MSILKRRRKLQGSRSGPECIFENTRQRVERGENKKMPVPTSEMAPVMIPRKKIHLHVDWATSSLAINGANVVNGSKLSPVHAKP